jgi:hypothetical protein
MLGAKRHGRFRRGAIPARDQDPVQTTRTRPFQDVVQVVGKILVLEMGVSVDDPR